MKPWLLIDVDGVLNPVMSGAAAKRGGFVARHAYGPAGWRYKVHLSPEHGRWLVAMADVCDLAWATTWEHTADREFGPVLRMPPLPVVTFDFARAPGSKVPGILRFTAARPFIWIDDDVTDLDRDLLADSGTHHLVLEPDPHVGLTRAHLDQARAWTADLT